MVYDLQIINGWIVRDGLADDAHRRLDAHVRSGDYFSTLATQLDELSDQASQSNISAQLEQCVRDLLYIDGHYKIVAKNTQKTSHSSELFNN